MKGTIMICNKKLYTAHKILLHNIARDIFEEDN